MSESAAALRTRIDCLMLRDRSRLRRRLAGVDEIADPIRRKEVLAAIGEQVAAAELHIAARRAAMPGSILYPDDLPISEQRGPLLEAIRRNQVVVVAGETGSGKSTQLPKLCLELGRGVVGFIGHTQPRRIAARSIAERVAEELGGEVGGLVGYTVRFSDQVGDSTLVKLMTDGILLNEIHHDRRLLRYDTIILDEAHERTLNIDFLLGYLKRLLPKRRDLKLIITSATIDTARFAEHFEGAPVVEVSGRSHPVEIRYRPLDDPAAAEPRDQPQGIADAIVELAGEGDGDVLVFCSGEREIRDATEAIADVGLRFTEVVPLFGRLSAAEQHRVFQPHTGRRIVVATNVAETSLTVPGIRYVVDGGTARIARFSRRTKVQRLPIEPISKASADQRAGRCGRLGPGICIRLYDEDDYEARPDFTEPEIQRTNLAAVILQMAALGLGDVASFPFLDPPDTRAVRDGVNLLLELGAIDPDHAGTDRWLTPIGKQLARIPLDPRLGRMLVEGARNGCLREMLVIVSALAIQDPRERPLDHETQADQRHARYRDPESDFLSWLRLWEFISEKRRSRSSSQFRKMCREEFLNYKRLREWQDVHRQLREVAAELDLTVNRKPATPEIVHLSLLAGLLSHVGKRDPEGYEYRGARSTRFYINPGSTLFRRAPEWVMAADLVETTRLWARDVAAIPVEWIEQLAAHLIDRTYSDPWWNAERGAAVAKESVTLFGIPLATDRTVQYAALDPAGAREMFIRNALVAGEWETHHEFAARNQQVFEEVFEIQTRERRSDLLVDDDVLFAFFDARIPEDVVTGGYFDRWWRDARHEHPQLLELGVEDLIDPDAKPPDPTAFPEVWQFGDVAMPLHYEHDPASRHDGVTIDVPLGALDRVSPTLFEWNVPGLRRQLVETLVRSMPKQYRRRFVPIPETVDRLVAALEPEAGAVTEAVRRHLTEIGGVAIPPEAVRLDALPPHLRPVFRIVGGDGEVVAEGDDLHELKEQVAAQTRAAVSTASHDIERDGVRAWDMQTLPRVIDLGEADHRVRAYPALVDQGDSVAVRLLATAGEQAEAMRIGTARLLLLAMPSPQRLAGTWLGNEAKLLIRSGPHDSTSDWTDDVLLASAMAIVDDAGGPAWDGAGFVALRDRVKDELADRVDEVATVSLQILGSLHRSVSIMESLPDAKYDAAIGDIEEQIDQLVYPDFLATIGAARLPDVARYLAAMERRLERLPTNLERDGELTARIHDLEHEYERLLDLLPSSPELIDIAWMIQELRVSLFAQTVGTKGKVSEKRVRQALERVARA